MAFLAQNLAKTMFCSILLIELCLMTTVVMGEVYKVGDSDGWTSKSKSNYASWASSKTFHVKDVLLFEYNATNDNVILVTLPEFRSCNTSSPMKMFNSGNDSFPISSPGHYYFTSNVSGHCEAGQKLDVRVLKHPIPASPPSPSPSPSSATVESKALAPGPSEGNAAARDHVWLMSTIGVTISALVVLFHSGV